MAIIEVEGCPFKINTDPQVNSGMYFYLSDRDDIGVNFSVQVDDPKDAPQATRAIKEMFGAHFSLVSAGDRRKHHYGLSGDDDLSSVGTLVEMFEQAGVHITGNPSFPLDSKGDDGPLPVQKLDPGVKTLEDAMRYAAEHFRTPASAATAGEFGTPERGEGRAGAGG